MRRSALFTPCLLAAAALASAASAASLAIPIDQSRPIALRGDAASVVVGNPAVADVNLIDKRNVLVLGKGYGVTNLLVLDKAGRPLFSGQITVSSDDVGRMSLDRGAKPVQYACSPRCEQISKSDASGSPPSPPAGPAALPVSPP